MQSHKRVVAQVLYEKATEPLKTKREMLIILLDLKPKIPIGGIFMQKLAIDWAHDEDKFVVYDGEEFVDPDTVEPTEDLVVFTENFPDDRIEEWTNKGAKIYGCGTHKVQDRREELGWEKSDKNDAKVLWKLSKEHPEIGDIFYEVHSTPEVLAQWRIMEDMKEQRKKAKQRNKAYEYMDLDDNVKEFTNTTNRLSTKVRHALEEFEIWNNWLSNISGVGETVAGGLVGQVYKKRIGQFEQPSSLWHYCGLHVQNGKAAGRTKGEQIDYNPKLKTILLKYLGDGIVKQRTEKYRDLYDWEKERQLNKEYAPGYLAENYNGYDEEDTHLTQGHANNRAKRRAVKEFVKHLWYIWRVMEGESTETEHHNKFLVEPPYSPIDLDGVEVVGLR